MVWSFLRRCGQAASAAAATALVSAGTLAGGAAFAQEVNSEALDWYIFVGRNANDNPIVVFFQSEHQTTEFDPVGSIAFVLNADYTPPQGEFDPTLACRWTSLTDFSTEDARALRTRIIYGPNSDQGQINYIDLPSYMAQQTTLSLLQEGVLIDERATVPYFNCAGFVWSQLLAQSPEAWDRTISAFPNAE